MQILKPAEIDAVTGAGSGAYNLGHTIGTWVAAAGGALGSLMNTEASYYGPDFPQV